MVRGRVFVLAHGVLFSIVFAGRRADKCELATTTIYVPTTVYAFAPNATRREYDCTASLSSIAIIPSTNTVVTTTDVTSSSTANSTHITDIASLSSASSAFTSITSLQNSSSTASKSITRLTNSTISLPTSTIGLSSSTQLSSFSSIIVTDPVGTSTPSTPITSFTLSPTSEANSSITTRSTVQSSSTLLPTPTASLPPSPPPGPFRGYKNSAYFTNWGISTEGYTPQDLAIRDLTHILYAFADVSANGTVSSSDPNADVQKRYPRDSPGELGNNAYGAVKQLFAHKKNKRNLKLLLSIGGWNYSPKFAAATSTEATRQTFAQSAVKLVTDWGFDGIDIDWEYPSNANERDNFVKLVAACRQEFDRYSFHNGLFYRFLITVASSASPANHQNVNFAEMNRYVDIWHLMAYDYSGSWDVTSGHQANVFADKGNTAATKISTNDAVQYYESQGISSQKIVMGLPLYGRSFEGTSGLGQNYTNVGSGGPQAGVWYYKQLPKRGAKEQFDDVAKATYSYDPSIRELISYDNVRSTTFKAHYVSARRLGGAFFWEASGDRSDSKSLISTMAHTLGWLDSTPNNLRYPTSQYHNIRSGMPGS
ncbi:glycoside hydrolase family 18 protein [Xylariaceae sp. FL1019]|nr:glycoside hydrolase family 18 protein [Xylariaceae sp. FL1019]